MHRKKSKYKIGSLPRSREEALNNSVRVVGLDVKETSKNLRKGYFEPYRWVLNRPVSLQYDLGIKLTEPTVSGELIIEI